MKREENAIVASETSIESLKKSEELAWRLRERILDLAQRAGARDSPLMRRSASCSRLWTM
jgi:hypothetical protein